MHTRGQEPTADTQPGLLYSRTGLTRPCATGGAVTNAGVTRVAAEGHRLELIPGCIVPLEFFRNTQGSRQRHMGEVGWDVGVGKAIQLKGTVRGAVRKRKVAILLVSPHSTLTFFCSFTFPRI